MERYEYSELQLFSPPGGETMKFPVADMQQLYDPDTGVEMLPPFAQLWFQQPEPAGAAGEDRPRLALIDSGVLPGHSIIKRCLAAGAMVDFTGEGPIDTNGHGTVTALIALGALPWPVWLFVAKVTPRNGQGTAEGLVRAIDWAREQAVQAIIMRSGVYRTRLRRIIECDGGCMVCRAASAAAEAGIVLDLAGGNVHGQLACPATLGRLGVPFVIAAAPPDRPGDTTATLYYSGERRSYQVQHTFMGSGGPPGEDLALAMALEESDPSRAAELYRELRERSAGAEAAHAASRLAELLDRRGEDEAAAEAYRHPAIQRHRDYAARAGVRLGNLLQKNGDIQGAEAANRAVIATGHREFAPMAAHNLGRMLLGLGRTEEAKDVLRAASVNPRSEWAMRANYLLGMVLLDEGDRSGAREALESARDSADPAVAADALEALARLAS